MPTLMPVPIRSISRAAPSAAQNGNLSLPFLATFAAHNTKHQVANPRQPPSIQHSRASSPRDKMKSGKNGNVDWRGQHCRRHTRTLDTSPPCWYDERVYPPRIALLSGGASPRARPAPHIARNEVAAMPTMSSTTTQTDAALTYVESHRQQFLDGLLDLLRIPSISTLPKHKKDIKRAAKYIAGELERIGLKKVNVIKTDGTPLVYGEWLAAP